MKMQRVIPTLPVRHMPTSVEFYVKMGFALEKRNDEWRWAMLVLDECRLMVDELIDQPPDAPRTSVIYLYPDDIFAYHRDVRRRWRQVGHSIGMSESDLDQFVDAFEHLERRIAFMLAGG